MKLFAGKKPASGKEKSEAAILLLLLLIGAGIYFFPRKTARQENLPEKMPVEIPGKKAKLVFVVDDIGSNRRYEKELSKLGRDVTYAVFPKAPYSKYFADLARGNGAEVILHLPLESLKKEPPDAGMITGRMRHSEAVEILKEDLDSVPGSAGVNNHMGSLGTADPELVKTILREIKKRKLFFLDSLTAPEHVTQAEGKKFGVPVLRRDIFLDNVEKEDAIRGQVRKLKKIARQRGFAIGIGHYREITLKVIKEEIVLAKIDGFELVRLADLLKGKNPASKK